jgi:Lrp/AsnC family transcriptional regulator for asnA, asnC and gidA
VRPAPPLTNSLGVESRQPIPVRHHTACVAMSAIIGISVLPRLQAVSERLTSCPEVRYIGVATGRYDIIVEAFFNDQAHLLEFVSTKLGALEGVTGAETNLILKVAKFSYEWEIP